MVQARTKRNPSNGPRARTLRPFTGRAVPSSVDTVRPSAADLFNLAAETPATPMHVGAIVVLDGPLRLSTVHEALTAGLTAAPRLRQVLRHRRWVDDPDFRLGRHVSEVTLPAPADDAALLRLAERLLAPPLDRAHPLWHLWLVTGARTALVIALHHVVADGLAAIDLITTVLGGPRTQPPPRHLGRLSLRALLAAAGRVSPTSLNRPTGAPRRVELLRLDLAEAKRVAHAHGGKVNDVLLGLVTGGVRALLAARGEPVAHTRVRASVAVSRRAAAATRLGNQVGSQLVWLPVGEPDPAARLRIVVARTRAAKHVSPAGAGLAVQALIVRLGLVRWFIGRQRMITFIESDLAGPPAPIRLLGLRVLDLVPVTPLAGNLTVAFVTLSYAGLLTLAVHGDAGAVPVLTAAMAQDWAALRTSAAQ